jgi:hypothetical protein
MKRVYCLLILVLGMTPAQTLDTDSDPARATQQTRPGATAAAGSNGVARYSPYAVAGGYDRHRDTFWDFWSRQFNPRNIDYGTWLEQRRRAFLEQAGANPYFWFSFWALGAICFLLLWLAKERIDRKCTEWEAASSMADLANYAEFCKRNAMEAIREHNEHVEVCNRVIESAETGRPVTPGASGPQWKAEMEALREKAETMEAANARLKAQLEAKEASLTALSARVDELARLQDGKPNGAGANSNPNLDLVARVNRLTAELEALRDENKRLKRTNQDASRAAPVR